MVEAVSSTNLLVVDSSTDAEALEELQPSTFNFTGADIRAVGENIVLKEQVSGTSFSTPLVAGLAAYLWNLSPALRRELPAATADLIRRSGRLTTRSSTVPLLDGYAAVLRLDSVPGCCTADLRTPVRLGLLDVNRDGNFDHLDLVRFRAAYRLDDPARPSIPEARDFSRFDLNGDGLTGGIPIAALDLDVGPLGPDDMPVINAVEASIEGFGVTFDEAALSDVQILCFYAYSDLYARAPGNRDEARSERSNLLGHERCLGPVVLRGLVQISLTQRSTTTSDSSTSERVRRLDVSSPAEFDVTRGELVLLSAVAGGSIVRTTHSVSAIDRAPCFFDAVTDTTERTTLTGRGPEPARVGFAVAGETWAVNSFDVPVTSQLIRETRRSSTNIRGECTGFDFAPTTDENIAPSRNDVFDEPLSLLRLPAFQGVFSRDSEGRRILVVSDSLDEVRSGSTPENGDSVSTSIQLNLREEPRP